MSPLPIIALVALVTLRALVWHDQPATKPVKTSLPENSEKAQQGRRP